ncbi:hypothetical protein E2C01_061967 [Portunus trituberculatus]|uniref:Uncharacterized protein n=1 Tax=Portunus trituberculatus TaxID=210409 RepID=A0A5B7HCD7_PORTR|nr:hypothetical protein [Portunus trituberculatus]
MVKETAHQDTMEHSRYWSHAEHRGMVGECSCVSIDTDSFQENTHRFYNSYTMSLNPLYVHTGFAAVNRNPQRTKALHSTKSVFLQLGSVLETLATRKLSLHT